MTEIVHGRYEVTIDGIKGNAKGMRSQAHVETTTTGVKWTFTGELATALLTALRPSHEEQKQ